MSASMDLLRHGPLGARRRVVLLSWVVLALAVLACAWELSAVLAVDDWWTDELATRWYTTPGVPFGEAFWDRFSSDPVPPLYYTIMYWVRRVIDLPAEAARPELLAVNLALIGLAAQFVLTQGARSGLKLLSRWAVALWLISGPLVAYAPEGRSYALAMAEIFVAAWLSAQAVARPDLRLGWRRFAVLGGLAAVTHAYAAMGCGALGAGLCLAAVLTRQWRLFMAGMAMGLATTVVTVCVTLGLGGASAFVDAFRQSTTLDDVRAAIWEVKQLVGGGTVGAACGALAVLLALIWPPARMLAIQLVTTLALFAVVPLAISLKLPIISGRYWLIGAPMMIVFPLFIARACIPGARLAMRRPRMLMAVVALFFCLSSALALDTALARTQNKPVWRGAPLVRSAAAACPAGSVHTLDTPEPYTASVPTPPDLFVEGADPDTPPLDAATAPCPVLGWAEHVLRGDGFSETASAETLLDLLKINAAPDQVRIVRYRTGFVVLKADAR